MDPHFLLDIFTLCSVASLVVILSLVHFLMALAANYAHIRGHDKFSELQDLQVDMTSESMMLTDRDVYK